MSDSLSLAHFRERLDSHIRFLYPDHDAEQLARDVLAVFADFESLEAPSEQLWDATDTLLITYGDSLREMHRAPLKTLNKFLKTYAQQALTSVHVLPFCPFSSDDGFSVIDYMQVNPTLGDWYDIESLSSDYRIMADLVINHVSAESEWFQNYVCGNGTGSDFFIEADPNADLSDVVRPRSSPLLKSVTTANGLRHVWCTFSHDQIDLDFSNPKTLLKFLEIIREYISRGVSLFRLDAIGYLWKKPGTTCVHLPETHEVVRLIRSVIDCFAPGTLLITETNVPNRENLTYFGNRNEAHLIYNFSLAPLLVHALLSGTAKYLKMWMMSMPPAPLGCTYLNFTASHDGIGMRPAEGLLSDEEQEQLVRTIESFGGRVSLRQMADGTERIYEINVSLFDAVQGTIDGPDHWQVDRFLCSQTIMMSLEGVPAFYIHSLLATPNDVEGVRRTGRNRSINRHHWDYDQLCELLENPNSNQSRVLKELLRRIRIRQQQAAFHPNATQFTLQLKPHFFAFWRQSMDRAQSIFCISNLSHKRRRLKLSELNLICTDQWFDLLRNEPLQDLYGSIELTPYQNVWITNRSSVA